ncbi:hypothetical protein [Bradyrhizobium elkanii]|uniref:hypothetical protein n=1 Tax=Bradyrhizobium elkanii TaxID=29448 RepID=UPI001BABBFA2|nr:hypothetical protein [Bradyrhizobium elkanii]MBR1165215.1 hypothetical protein [Bradyrhizobium elkanii]
MARAAAIKATRTLAAKLLKNPDGTFAVPPSLSEADLNLLDVLLSSWRAKAAFNGDRLCEDFFAALKSNGLISNREAAAPFLDVVVQLFAIASIHGSNIVMSDGTTIKLAVVKNADPDLRISAAIPVQSNGTPFFISTDLVITNLERSEYCDADLDARSEWNGAVELGNDRRLHFLG